jgi:aspartyl-tRNA(Asn)/glutamyl-tRNA(Gln) amidotransferase subunit C
MPIHEDEVRRIAALANLELTPEEISRFTHDLSRILDYIDQLKEVDTENVAPLDHVHERTGQGRPDEVGECLSPEEALRNAPDREVDLFRVPRVVE